MNKTRRRRQRRNLHQQRCAERNRERGFTSSDVVREHGSLKDSEGNALTLTPEQIACMSNAEIDTLPDVEQTDGYGKKLTLPLTPEQDKALHEHQLAVSPNSPTEDEWNEMLAKAKSRKRGVDKIAKQFGFELKGDDKKDRLAYEKVAA